MLAKQRYYKAQKYKDPRSKDISLHGKGKSLESLNHNPLSKKNFEPSLCSRYLGDKSRFAAISPDDEVEDAP